MNYKKKNSKVLLIGGAGFIGHNLALKLKFEGVDVEIIDSFQVNNLLSLISNTDKVSNPNLSSFIIEKKLKILKNSNIPIHIVDARDYHSLSKYITKINPDYVVHLAAVSHANRSNKDPYTTFDNSLRTLENALDASRNRIKKFIYLSSSMVYGNFKTKEVDEETNCNPIGIYGALKFSGEKIVIAYNQVFDLPYTIIRPSALYGERCISRRVGQIFIENALEGKEITIDGDGEDKLDFTYIQDLIQGIIRSIFIENGDNQIFNITYGNSRSIKELIDILKNDFPKLKIVKKPRDKLMPIRGTLSGEKAKKLLEYNPEWPLEKGYVEYIKWYKEIYDSYLKNV